VGAVQRLRLWLSGGGGDGRLRRESGEERQDLVVAAHVDQEAVGEVTGDQLPDGPISTHGLEESGLLAWGPRAFTCLLVAEQLFAADDEQTAVLRLAGLPVTRAHRIRSTRPVSAVL
jgi:hypothetical protein